MEINEQEPVHLAQCKRNRMIKRNKFSQLKNFCGNSYLPKIFRLGRMDINTTGTIYLSNY